LIDWNLNVSLHGFSKRPVERARGGKKFPKVRAQGGSEARAMVDR